MASSMLRLRSSIEWRLPAMMCGLVLLVTAVLSWAAFLQVRRSAEAVAADRLAGVSAQMAIQSGQEQAEVKRQARRLAENPKIVAFAMTRSASARLAAMALLAPDSTITAQFLDSAGGEIASSDSQFTGHVPPAILSEARGAAAGADSGAIGRMSARRDRITYPVVAMVNQGRARLGYIVQWHELRPNPSARARIETLFGANAALYLGSTPGIWTDQSGVVPGPAIDDAALGKPVRYLRDGQGMRMAVGARVPGTPWIVALEYSERAILAPTRQFLDQIALIAFAVFIVALGVTWVLSRHITGPLRTLTAAADVRAAGESAVRAPVHGHDELSRLAAAFNAMADSVDAEVLGRRTSEAQWRLLFRANPHPMYVFDLDTMRFLAVNDAAVAKYGYTHEEFLAMTVADIRPAEEISRMTEFLIATDTQPAVGGLWRHRTKAGQVLDVQIDANSLMFDGRRARLVLAQDFTERRTLEAQLRQAQRLEAVGQLAGGVAHDFNNLLLVIMTYTQLLHDRLAADDPAKEELASVLGAAERAQTLTRQLLALSRQQVLQPVVLDPNATLQSVQTLLRRVIGEDVTVQTNLSNHVGSVLVDPGQLEQVLLNLAVNARDAMPSGGRLTVSTSSVDLDANGAALHGVANPGRYVVIAVADTGIGMTAETRTRIFDPFFTTKEVGKGTGLGLSIVYGIVTQSGGAITVYSEPGLGTTFRVYLPRVDSRQGPAAKSAPSPTVTGHEVILLVEDESAVRKATQHALEHLGYAVIPAASGPDALAVVAQHAGPVDLVISDVIMPGMDGPTLLARLRAQHPTLKALLVSGYSKDAVATRGFANASALFLQKPFSVAVLSQKVREALDGRTTTFS